MITKEEAKLKAAFMRELVLQLPDFVTLRYATAGAPDREIVGNNFVSFFEFKHATPRFRSPGNQELTMCRLARVAYARYVIWRETPHGGKSTMIVHPLIIHERTGWDLVPEAVTIGFDHEWLVEQVKRVHGL